MSDDVQWQEVTDTFPADKVKCVIKTRAGNVRIGYRLGDNWYVQYDGQTRLSAFMVVKVIVLPK